MYNLEPFSIPAQTLGLPSCCHRIPVSSVVVTWAHESLRLQLTAAAGADPALTQRHTHIYTHPKLPLGFTRSSLSTQARGIPDSWSDCNCWHPDPLSRGSLTERTLKEGRTSWAGQVQLWPEKHTKGKTAPDWPLFLSLSSHKLFLPKLSRSLPFPTFGFLLGFGCGFFPGF